MDVSQDELEFKWFEAAKYYEEAISSSEDTGLPAAQYWQRIGFCYGRASRQARDQEDFKKLRQQAVQAYKKAAELFGKNSELKSKGESSKCLALAEHMQSWIASNSAEKDEFLKKCHSFGREALAFFEKAGDDINYGKICNILSQCLFDRIYMAPVESEKMDFVKEGIELSDIAISIFEKHEIKEDLVSALYLATLHNWYLANIGEQETLRKDSLKNP